MTQYRIIKKDYHTGLSAYVVQKTMRHNYKQYNIKLSGWQDIKICSTLYEASLYLRECEEAL